MGYAERVTSIASGEADARVAWKTHEARILEYFQISTGKVWTKRAAFDISWCTYFVHWVLWKAGVQPFPLAGTSTELKGVHGSVGRFLKGKGGVYQEHAVYQHKYTPKAGDLYYQPNPSNHVGIIEKVDGKKIWTIDGNSGPKGWDARFDMSFNKSLIGYGFIYRPPLGKTLGSNDFYIELPS
jgi:CHAP domain-containing protein